jgi:pimeloyl-ACP methyl ester carboxylesterase
VADVVAMADQLGAPRFHLVGHDWGGIVAWAFAAAHPERLHSLTSVSMPHPAACADSLLHSLQPLRSSYVGLFALPGVAELVLGGAGAAGLRTALRLSGLPKADAERYARAVREPGALTGALAWYRALVAGALRHSTPSVGVVEVPTLYVWGRHDGALGPVAARATARYVEAPYRFVDLDAGHWIPETRTEQLTMSLLAHLDRQR